MQDYFIEDNGELAALGLLPGNTVNFSSPGETPGRGSGGVPGLPRPWGMTLTYDEEGNATADFSYCHLMLGPILKTYSTGTTNVDLSAGTTGDHVIFARLLPSRALDVISISNTATGDDRYADVTAVPVDGKTRIPLYAVTREAAMDRWRIILDYRDMSLNQYV